MLVKLLFAALWVVKHYAALAASPATSCSDIASSIDFDSYHATHLNTTYRAAGTVQQPSGASKITNTIDFCEIYTSINYAKDAHLVFVLWLPNRRKYKQRFLAVGNGGYAGIIETSKMMELLNLGLGFAVAGGDAGHDAYAETNGTANGQPGLKIPFLQHPDRTKALIRNAISIFTPIAEALTTEYYDKKPKYKFFYGCSVGGAQGYALARYHTDLYDGIYAGAPGADHDDLTVSFLRNFRAEANNVLPQDALDLVPNPPLPLQPAQKLSLMLMFSPLNSLRKDHYQMLTMIPVTPIMAQLNPTPVLKPNFTLAAILMPSARHTTASMTSLLVHGCHLGASTT